MYYRKIILAALLAASVTACAAAPATTGDTGRFERLLAAQQKGLDEANSRLDELSIKVLLLQEKLSPGRADRRVATGVAADAPPPGLAVVELKETGGPDVVLKDTPEKILSLKLSKEGGQKKKKKKGKKAKPESAAVRKIGPKGLYSTAQNLFLEGRHDEARAAFGLFTTTYPKHALADNAYYWLGESYYSERRYDRALKSFLKVADFYPNENKAPDALLKAGFTYIDLEDYANASRAFKRLVSSYPDSVAAGKADRTLKTLLSHKKEGPK